VVNKQAQLHSPGKGRKQALKVSVFDAMQLDRPPSASHSPFMEHKESLLKSKLAEHNIKHTKALRDMKDNNILMAANANYGPWQATEPEFKPVPVRKVSPKTSPHNNKAFPASKQQQ